MDSPVPKNVMTPIKRLGLSRRKPTVNSPHTPAVLHNLDSTPAESPTPEAGLFTPTKIRNSLPEISPKTDNDPYLKELNLKLASLNNTLELEQAITTWKTGCKDSLIDLKEWLSAEEGLVITYQSLAENLGIGSVIREHFENDTDIFDD